MFRIVALLLVGGILAAGCGSTSNSESSKPAPLPSSAPADSVQATPESK